MDEEAGRMTAYAERMGLTTGQTVREIGWDEDTDPAVRDAIRRATGAELLDEDSEVAVDVVLYWWRNGDGDLANELMYAVGPLSDGGAIWVLTPRAGIPGHILASDLAEATADADLHHATTAALGAWTGHRITRRPPAS
ncbi:DUF3052 domain-containing protein [Streptomyces sp. NPDC058326]|uniref:DUF3052 domain-containing protein n=1 Tax=Streptomyces sp. NPDC058326 TaxID=3346447 RepID=UPI0036EC1FEA